MRECGECSVCCYVGAVEPISPAYSHCPYLVDGAHRCGIYNEPDRPAVCHEYQCAWLKGIGREEDRPDRIGAVFGLKNVGRGLFGLCVETEPDAITNGAAEMAAAFVRTLAVPLMVVPPESEEDDRVVILAEQELKAVLMTGPYIGTLAQGVTLYELRRRK